MKYSEFEPHLDDILIHLKTNLAEALLTKVNINKLRKNVNNEFQILKILLELSWCNEISRAIVDFKGIFLIILIRI